MTCFIRIDRLFRAMPTSLAHVVDMPNLLLSESFMVRSELLHASRSWGRGGASPTAYL